MSVWLPKPNAGTLLSQACVVPSDSDRSRNQRWEPGSWVVTLHRKKTLSSARFDVVLQVSLMKGPCAPARFADISRRTIINPHIPYIFPASHSRLLPVTDSDRRQKSENWANRVITGVSLFQSLPPRRTPTKHSPTSSCVQTSHE